MIKNLIFISKRDNNLIIIGKVIFFTPKISWFFLKVCRKIKISAKKIPYLPFSNGYGKKRNYRLGDGI